MAESICGCEPAPGEDLRHDAECPRNYDDLRGEADIARMRRVLILLLENDPEVTARMAEGVKARAVELGLEKPD